MLRNPFGDKDFEPNLMWFIGVFNVYDREETRGEELKMFNPDNPLDREMLIVRYSLKLGCLSYRHKYLLYQSLDKRLRDPNCDFQAYFDIDDVYDSSWPRAEWYTLKDARCFFEEVFRLASVEWKDDLHKASLEDGLSR